jgi:hypothetical protein
MIKMPSFMIAAALVSILMFSLIEASNVTSCAAYLLGCQLVDTVQWLKWH